MVREQESKFAREREKLWKGMGKQVKGIAMEMDIEGCRERQR